MNSRLPNSLSSSSRSQIANRLMSPSEMGELFKAIAFGRGFSTPLLGFREGDRRQAL